MGVPIVVRGGSDCSPVRGISQFRRVFEQRIRFNISVKLLRDCLNGVIFLFDDVAASLGYM